MAAGGVGGVKSLHILMLVLLQQLWFQPVTSTTEEPNAWRQTGPRLQLSHSGDPVCDPCRNPENGPHPARRHPALTSHLT
ncbi:hypothetical protein KUCAC02_036561 [Chaenocephalus aceratus]|nr:hypothetical protein KUCAC02_036561 [Chaenocephalus aceratus]